MFNNGVELDWRFGPLEALRRWPADRKLVLLHSGRSHPQWSRWSVLAEPVGSYRFEAGGASHWIGPRAGCPNAAFTNKPFRALRAILDQDDALWIGYLSYDLGRWIERLPVRAVDDRDWPIIDLGYCPGYAVYDSCTGRWRAFGRWRKGERPDLTFTNPQQALFSASEPQSVFTRQAYEQSIAAILRYIAAGDVFQVNLAQRFSADLHGPYPLAQRALFGRLAVVSPAWYGAYLETADDPKSGSPGRIIASTSPELFLQVDEAGEVITRPIKGTRPVAADPDELRHSEKDTAELNMIVDLLRNDLGRVCAYGSVRVVQPRTVETHPTVHHGVATIAGRLHRTKSVGDLLRATMPGGSVTGAPKVRAMQIIDELEPVRRGPYCGCIGYLSRRATCLNIAIRTMLLDPVAQRLDYSVGGGIVADSDTAAEYEETIDKAAAILAAMRPTSSPLDASSPHRHRRGALGAGV